MSVKIKLIKSLLSRIDLRKTHIKEMFNSTYADTEFYIKKQIYIYILRNSYNYHSAI